ncbi:hypothetical protein BpJC7_19880 [Weizmannia acidilactici]|uniref:Thioredoxin-like protein n=1 Tax=Weizmannia acidilactici TaxID=2607726 RepID=A0A5J4JIZ9_9BACI|nr:thioredoxin family protein [Weizmannia acidilactici]GER67994.1 hypothetical protein BpJC4_24650 [Weizmannia acidilactici]GER70685.1 hypothetical protein BpJC7_19880 [Weizmannia acidilactici]GER74178.1 hypothetical protein BpPP18_22450 [Weizmannia acidilactici]
MGKLKSRSLRSLVLTEDWCGDAMLNIPILLKSAEVAGICVKMVYHDDELMDQYLTNGSRPIPFFIFLNERGEEAAVWIPRSPSLKKSSPTCDQQKNDLQIDGNFYRRYDSPG